MTFLAFYKIMTTPDLIGVNLELKWAWAGVFFWCFRPAGCVWRHAYIRTAGRECVWRVLQKSATEVKRTAYFFQNSVFFFLVLRNVHVFLLDCILSQSWFDLSMWSTSLSLRLTQNQSIQLNCMNINGGTNCIGIKCILIRFQHEWVWSLGSGNSCQGRREGSVEGWGRVKRRQREFCWYSFSAIKNWMMSGVSSGDAKELEEKWLMWQQPCLAPTSSDMWLDILKPYYSTKSFFFLFF